MQSATDAMPGSDPIQVQNLVVLPERGEVHVDGTSIALTPREMEVLLVLATNQGRVIQRAEIYDAVWGGVMPYRDRSVDVWVKKLRRKLAAGAPGYRFVHTHYGFGYRLSVEPV